MGWDLLHSGISEMLQMWVFHHKVRILSGMCCGWKWRDRSGKEGVTIL